MEEYRAGPAARTESPTLTDRNPRSAYASVVAVVLLATLAAPAPRAAGPGEKPSAQEPGGEPTFFTDYYFRVLGRTGQVWPYLGGHGDASGDLSSWKFPSRPPPGGLPLPELVPAMAEAILAALDWDRDGVDVLLAHRLFIEVVGLLAGYAAYPAWIDPRTCQAHFLPDDESFPPPPWRPPDELEGALTNAETETFVVLGTMLCEAAERRAALSYLRGNEPLLERLDALEAATRDLESAGYLLLSEVGAVPDDLLAEIGTPPPAAQAFAWIEELDTVLGLLHARRRGRPDWITPAEAYLLEARGPAGRVGALVGCAAWVGRSGTLLRESDFFEHNLSVGVDDLVRFREPPLPYLEPGRRAAAAAVGARLGAALYGAAAVSAEQDGVDLLQAERLRLPPRGPGGERVWTTWVGNPWEISRLLKRNAERAVLEEEFGTSFGGALADYRDRLRDRVRRHADPGADPEKLLHALARLGIDKLLAEPLEATSAEYLVPWLRPDTLEELRRGWAARTRALRSEGLHRLVRAGLDDFRTIRNRPPMPVALFKIRALQDLHACVGPLLPADALEKDRRRFLHARQNVLDGVHAELAAVVRRSCEEGAGTRLLQARARAVAAKLLPGTSAAELDELLGPFHLEAPCEAPAETLLRFGALYDVLTAVFAAESHAAGGSFDSPFDRRAALSVGPAPFAEVDRWLIQFQRFQWQARWSRRRPREPDPVDRVPALLRSVPFPSPDPDDARLAAVRARWSDAFREAVSGRGYPADLRSTGWRPLDDYIEEEERRRRIDVFPAEDPEEGGYVIRAVFGATVPYGRLLDGQGRPAGATEWIRWSRRNGDPDGYVVEYGRPDEAALRFVLPLPHHPGVPGPASLAAAQRFAELYLRHGDPGTEGP